MGDKAHFYDFLGCLEVEDPNTVITGNILVYDHMNTMLFDPISTFSYSFAKFALGMDIVYEILMLLFMYLFQLGV